MPPLVGRLVNGGQPSIRIHCFRCLEALAQWGKAAFQALIAIEVGKDDGDTLFSEWVGSITADKTQS